MIINWCEITYDSFKFFHKMKNMINGKLMDLFEDVFLELERAMNFSAHRAEEINGFRHSIGLLTPLSDHQVDLLLAPMTIISSRLDLIDFTKPLILSPHLIYFKQPDGVNVQWSAYFRVTFIIKFRYFPIKLHRSREIRINIFTLSGVLHIVMAIHSIDFNHRVTDDRFHTYDGQRYDFFTNFHELHGREFH